MTLYRASTSVRGYTVEVLAETAELAASTLEAAVQADHHGAELLAMYDSSADWHAEAVEVTTVTVGVATWR